jgi:hypothetical protein
MSKTNQQRKEELTCLIEAETPSWLTKDIYSRYQKDFNFYKEKVDNQFSTYIFRTFGERDRVPNPQWKYIDVEVSAETLVNFWNEGRIISPPSTGQDPKSYSTDNIITASEHFANHWGNEQGSFWLREGVVNLALYPNGSVVLESTDIEHRLWGIIGGALDLIPLKSNRRLKFKDPRIQRKIDDDTIVNYIIVNNLHISEIVEEANKYVSENDRIGIDDVLQRYYQGNFKLRVLPMFSSEQCHDFYATLNKADNKTTAQLLHANTSPSTQWLKTFSSIKLERFKAADYKLHPFLNLYENNAKIKLETFMIAHLVTQYTLTNRFVDSTDGKLRNVIEETYGYQRDFNEDLKDSVLEKFDILYEFFSKIENPKLTRQYIQQVLAIYQWIGDENMVICDMDIFSNALYNFIENERVHQEFNSDGTKNGNAGTKTRFGVSMAASNKSDYIEAFKHIKDNFLYDVLKNESCALTIGLCKKSNRVPRLFSNEIIIDSFNKQKGLDLDNTEIEGKPVGGHIISDSELIRMNDTERVEAFKSENLGDKFKFELNCRAMSSYHNLRMSVLRLSEYLEIINEPDSVVRKRVNEKREYLKNKPILV